MNKAVLLMLLFAFASAFSFVPSNARAAAGSEEVSVAGLTKKAESGDAESQYKLGLMYYEGEAVPKDFKKSFQWCEKAALQGHAKAMHSMGFLYFKGDGVPKDLRMAYAYFTNSAARGFEMAKGWGESTGRSLSPKDLAEAKEFARKISERVSANEKKARQAPAGPQAAAPGGASIADLTKKAESGDAAAQLRLGKMYNLAEGVGRDYAAAFKWMEKAALSGVAEAQFRLGDMYHFGEGVGEDEKKAAAWYEKAAMQGYALAQFALGDLCFEGRGVAADKKKAYALMVLCSYSVGGAPRYKEKIALAMNAAEIAEGEALAKKMLEEIKKSVKK